MAYLENFLSIPLQEYICCGILTLEIKKQINYISGGIIHVKQNDYQGRRQCTYTGARI
jgi:hypothetical protein